MAEVEKRTDSRATIPKVLVGLTVAAIVVLAGLVFVLASTWAFVPALISVVLLVIRTVLEDRTRQVELPGYAEYASRVRFRLIPGVW